MASSPGRPRKASRELLQEAAFELFQLQGYRQTTVTQIARTAGFSRATFFNFFASKAELFWVETDTLLERLRAHLTADDAVAREPLESRVLAFAATLEGADIPWALQHVGLLEAEGDLVASGASRVLALNRLFTRELRCGDPDAEASLLVARAGALTAALLAAVLAWIEAGPGRGRLSEHLEPLL